jgi:hypothetical protein
MLLPRADSTTRRQLADAVDAASPDLRDRLERLLLIEEGSRFSVLERLRTAPTRISGPKLVRALDRVAEVHAVGASAITMSTAPLNRVRARTVWDRRQGAAAPPTHPSASHGDPGGDGGTP